MKRCLLACVLSSAFFAHAGQAEVIISGQINQAAILKSDLDSATIVDNNTSGSRFRIKASKEFGEIKAGIRYEIQAQDNSSSGLTDSSVEVEGEQEGSTISEVRYSDIWFSGIFGKVALGKGDGAANGSFESYDLLGHYLAGDLARLAVGSAIDSGIAYRSIDGLSRQNRFRYDSPKFGGVKFALSFNNDSKSEFLGSYDGKMAGGKLRARLGITSGDNDTDDRTMASLAWKSAAGFGLGLSLADQGDGFDTNWVTLSYQLKKIIVQYNFGEDSNDNKMSVLGLNWKPAKGVEIYLNNVKAENADGSEGDATYLGSRIKF